MLIGQQLVPRPLKYLPGRDLPADLLEGIFGPPVAVVDGVLQKATRPVQQGEVDPPAVHCHRSEAPALARRGTHALEDAVVQTKRVPMKPFVDPYGYVWEAVDLTNSQTTPVKRTDGDPAALSTEIDRDQFHGPSPRPAVTSVGHHEDLDLAAGTDGGEGGGGFRKGEGGGYEPVGIKGPVADDGRGGLEVLPAVRRRALEADSGTPG